MNTSPRLAAPGRRPRVGGFTLVELLTVIAIIGVLAGILFPVIGKARDSARMSRNVANLHDIANIFQLYSQDNKGLLPRARETSRLAWPTTLLGYFQDVSVLVRPGAEVGDGLLNATTAGLPDTLDAGGNPINWSYVINGGSTTSNYPFVESGQTQVRMNAIKRPPQTMMLADAATNSWWINKTNLADSLTRLRFDNGLTTMLFFDGHVARIASTDITLATFNYVL